MSNNVCVRVPEPMDPQYVFLFDAYSSDSSLVP